MKTHRIAVIPGDGIGREVTPAGRAILDDLVHLAARRRRFDRDSGRAEAHR
jgi:isocitrate/isopropylmalate dehydrogenase